MIKVGDKIKSITTAYDSPMNKIGTVVVIDNEFQTNIGVKFDEWVEGHDLGGYCRYGYGWWLSEDELAPLGGENDAL